jgi:hypothetical protein
LLPNPTAGQGGQQKTPIPKFLSDEGKEVFSDIEDEQAYYGDNACESRAKLLKLMAGEGGQEASQHRARVLLGLGLCEYRKQNFPMSLKRWESTISELNVPSEDAMMQNPSLAPIGLMKQAAAFMTKLEVSQAGTALRRAAEVMDRNLKKALKQIHKQMSGGGQQAPPLEAIIAELPEFGKSGQILPMLLQQVPMLKQELAWSEVVDNALDALDKRIAAVDSSLKPKRIRLDLGKGKSKEGTILYTRALAAGAYVPHDNLAAAQELVSGGAVKAFAEEAEGATKSSTLLKRSKEGSGCKTMTKTCEALAKVADVKSNSFGETRVVVVKGKAVQLDVCTTNANVGIIVAAKAGVKVTVKGEQARELLPKVPIVIDFCREATLESESDAQVLFAQAWHPEFAAVERTTEVRARAKAFKLSEDEVKEVTKIINDNAKKNWDKGAKLWRQDSESLEAIKSALKNEKELEEKAKEEAAEAKRREDEANDEDKKAAIAELEKKRAAKREAAEAAEKKRLERKRQLEEERAKRDPWLKVDEVVQAEANLEDLKAQRRDANAKLEFDLSTSLTKDISKAERDLKKIIKKAKKEYKKAQKAAGGDKAKGAAEDKAADQAEDKAAEKKEDDKLAALKAELAEVKEKKKKAADSDDFKEAKRLKTVEQELSAKIAAQEKAEL